MSLEIESALRDLLGRSSDCVWRKDVENYAQCWATDGAWHILGEVHRGREAVAAAWSERMSRYARVWQVSHNVVFGFDRDLPAARLFLEEHFVTAGGATSVLKGIYHDTFTFEAGAWRFASRHIDLAYVGPPDLSGSWFPMVDHGPGPHDRDPSRPATPSEADLAAARAR
jgi:hypothetical protein